MAVEDIQNIDKQSLCYMNNIKLKRAGVDLPYTQEQLEEYVKCRDDLVYFITNYVYIVNLDQGLIKFGLFDFQREMVELFRDNRFSIGLTARQMGKCVLKNINIRIRNKKTGDVHELPIGDFYKMQRDRRDQQQIQLSDECKTP